MARKGGGREAVEAPVMMGSPGDGGVGGRRVKRSFMLSPETDIRLAVLAKMRGCERSEIAEGLLAEACKGVLVMLAPEGQG